jgi:hypothetical protein
MGCDMVVLELHACCLSSRRRVVTRDGLESMCSCNLSLAIRTRMNAYMNQSVGMLLGGCTDDVCIRRDRCAVVLGQTIVANGRSRISDRVKTVE